MHMRAESEEKKRKIADKAKRIRCIRRIKSSCMKLNCNLDAPRLEGDTQAASVCLCRNTDKSCVYTATNGK